MVFIEAKAIREIFKSGVQNEFQYEVALIIDKRLRILGKKGPSLKLVRKRLRDKIEEYELK